MRISIRFIQVLLLFIVMILNVCNAQTAFSEILIDDNTHGTAGIYACDLDSDSDMDLLAASQEDHQIIWFQNDGSDPIKWKKLIIAKNVYSAHSVSSADIDGDGKLDVVGAQYYDKPGVIWWRNNGGNPVNWTKYIVSNSFKNAHEIYTHDLDQDGDIDILGASSDLNKIAWWRNDGGSPITWTEQTLCSNATLAKSVHVGDFNADGLLDVVGASIWDHKIRWWKNKGGIPIEWQEYTITSSFNGAHRVQAVDLDDDGDDDILGAAYLGHQIAWWRNDGGDPVNWTMKNIGSNLTNACIALAVDLDGDLDKDIIGTIQGRNEVLWWRNDGVSDGNIQWTKLTLASGFTRPWPVFACDIDKDKDIDVIAGSSHRGNNQVKLWENTSSTFIKEENIHTKEFILDQNFPNPFNPATVISYQLPAVSNVEMIVYNLLGKKITTLVQDVKSAGRHQVSWDGTNKLGKTVPSGIYIYKIQAGQTLQSKKMIYLR